MTDPGESTRELLADKPDLETSVRELVVIDEQGPWTFDDAPLDSGAFGEIISRGIVEQTDGGYRLSDRQAVKAALDGEVSDNDDRDPSFEWSLPSLDRRFVGAITGGLVFVLFVRVLTLPSIYRDGAVVLSGNDPYYYRFILEAVLEGTNGFDPAVVTVLQDVTRTGDSLFVTTLWFFASILGGTAGAAGHVLAWYPVVVALLNAGIVYWVATTITADRRVGIAAILLLAVLPSHAFRTSLGFGDHTAFGLFWLSVTLLGLVVLSRREARVDDPWVWTGSAVLGIGIAGQTLGWLAGALLIVPVGLYVVLATAVSVNDDRSPYVSLAPVLTGVGFGAVLTQLFHRTLGWQSETIASIPVVLLAGTVGIVVITTLVRQFRADAWTVIATELVVALALWVTVWSLLPDFQSTFDRFTAWFLMGGTIAETASLTGGAQGWLLLFGFLLVMAIPFLVWGTRRGWRGDRQWLVVSVYTWYLLVLSLVQVRFAGHLGLLVAVVAGFGFVYLASWIDAARPPAFLDDEVLSIRSLSLPERKQAAVLVGLFLLVTSLSLIQAPVKMNQIVVDGETYDTARWVDEYAASTSDNGSDYVFSSWGQNRVYNYYLSGGSRSYGYAQSNYESFLGSTESVEWYLRLRGRGDAVFVVTADVDQAVDPRQMHARLHDALGSRQEGADGLAHYRPIYVASDGSPKVFSVVPGAAIVGHANANTTVTLSTSFDISGANRTYERRTTADASGRYKVVVPNPGTYTVVADSQTWTVDVPESAVLNGTGIYVND